MDTGVVSEGAEEAEVELRMGSEADEVVLHTETRKYQSYKI